MSQTQVLQNLGMRAVMAAEDLHRPGYTKSMQDAAWYRLTALTEAIIVTVKPDFGLMLDTEQAIDRVRDHLIGLVGPDTEGRLRLTEDQAKALARTVRRAQIKLALH